MTSSAANCISNSNCPCLSVPTKIPPSHAIINLDHGNPKMFEHYWSKQFEDCTVEIGPSQLMSYFSDPRKMCWFMDPELENAIRQLHQLVGNAVTTNKHILVGTGSSQLFQAAIHALASSHQESPPVSVVSAFPYYSSYSEVIEFLRPTLYRWEGDACSFNKDGPYIELVASPNNPDGYLREPVINLPGNKGMVVYDLAYYWPQYTPITETLDHDIMLFTFSKATGHAGSRIGWALVKDKDVARNMVKYIELSTIGVSRESQFRASKLINAINKGYKDSLTSPDKRENMLFFHHSKSLMENRWKRLREALGRNKLFSLPNYTPGYCSFFGKTMEPHPAFAWIKCENDDMQDCSYLLREHKILTRNGMRFGADSKYARVSMMDNDQVFDMFIERLSLII